MYKLRLEFDIRNNAFFFDNEYKKKLSSYFKEYMKDNPFVYSDVVPSRKRVSTEGFWAIKHAALDFCSPLQKWMVSFSLNVLKKPPVLNYGKIKFKEVRFLKFIPKSKGFVISPIVAAFPGEKPVEYEKQPELFSTILREILIKKYQKLYGYLPEDDRFIFFFKGLPTKEVTSGIIGYRGPFEIFGSNELIKFSYLSGLGSFNEYGYGMISPDLYFWKKM
jgi:CRISPR-associated endoribonuclease Cas6